VPPNPQKPPTPHKNPQKQSPHKQTSRFTFAEQANQIFWFCLKKSPQPTSNALQSLMPKQTQPPSLLK
jgi:hypothetical protein